MMPKLCIGLCIGLLMAAKQEGFLWWYTQNRYNIRLQSVTHIHLGFLPSFFPLFLPACLPALSGRACHYFTPGCSENISRVWELL